MKSGNLSVENYQSTENAASQKLVAKLASAGLNAVDLLLFKDLERQAQSTFVHGSIIKNRIKPESDIDFTVIGDWGNLDPGLRDTLMPGLLSVTALRNIHYVSTSYKSQENRKVSLHFSEPSFRENHPNVDLPFATEFRPARHAKLGDRKYFLPGVDIHGGIHLLNLHCTSTQLENDGGTVTDIPQTGQLTTKGKTIIIGDKIKTNMSVDEAIRISPSGAVDEGLSEDINEIMILGLEFDKMQSDTLLHGDPDAEQRFVQDPTKRSMELVGDFAKTNPAVVVGQLYSELAKYWPKVKPHKTR